MKKPARKSKTGNPGKKRPRGPAPEDRPRGWARWLWRELNAFLGMPYLSRQLVVGLLLVVVGAALWIWRSLTT